MIRAVRAARKIWGASVTVMTGSMLIGVLRIASCSESASVSVITRSRTRDRQSASVIIVIGSKRTSEEETSEEAENQGNDAGKAWWPTCTCGRWSQ